MESLLNDLCYGLRMLFRKTGFTAVALVTPAPGISANTAIFTVVNAAARAAVSRTGAAGASSLAERRFNLLLLAAFAAVALVLAASGIYESCNCLLDAPFRPAAHSADSSAACSSTVCLAFSCLSGG